MINIRLATEEDKEKWNNVVEQSDTGTIYHTWEWKEVIEKGLGDKGYHIIAEKDDEIVGIFPTFSRSIFVDHKLHKYFPFITNQFQSIYSPHPKIYGFGGPCAIGEETKIVDQMIYYLDQIIKKDGRIIFSWTWPFKEENVKNILLKNNYERRRERKTVFVNLNRSEEEILAGFKKKLRQQIRISIREGVSVEEAKDKSDLDLIYNELYPEFIKRISKNVNYKYGIVSNVSFNYSFFKAIWNILLPKKMAKVFIAEYKNKKIGALINFYYKNFVFLGFVTCPGEYSNRLHTYKRLVWHTMLDAKKNNYKILDLTGLPPDETHGQYRFKMSWNGKVVSFGEYKKIHRYIKLRNLKKMMWK